MNVIVSKRLIDRLSGKVFFRVNGVKYTAFFALKEGLDIDDRGSYVEFFTEATSGSFFDYSKETGKLSYHPRPHLQQVNEGGVWDAAGRQELKPGKLFNRLKLLMTLIVNRDNLDPVSELEDSKAEARALEVFADRLKADIINQKEIRDYEAVADIYMLPHASDEGTLSSSCMRHGFDFFSDFYEELRACGAKVSILAIVNGGTLYSRALLWRDVVVDGRSETISLVDRIYGSEASAEAYKEYARRNGYYVKCCQSYEDHDITNGEEVIPSSDYRLELGAEFDAGCVPVAPFMDTFFDLDGFILSRGLKHPDYTFRRTDGEYKGKTRCCCCGVACCDSFTSEEDDVYCEDCYLDTISYCSHCGGEINVRRENFVIINHTRNVFCMDCCSYE